MFYPFTFHVPDLQGALQISNNTLGSFSEIDHQAKFRMPSDRAWTAETGGGSFSPRTFAAVGILGRLKLLLMYIIKHIGPLDD